MPFATDRDLLILEPNLFRDVQWTAQRLISATATVSGTTLTASGVDFAASGVEAGAVAIVDGVPVEVVSRTSATVLVVSRPRVGLDDAAIPPSPSTSKTLTIHTFRPQIELVHQQVLRMVGIDPFEPAAQVAAGGGGALTEAAILNPRALRLVEALGTLHLIFAGASAIGGIGSTGPDTPIALRARFYRERFDEARRRAAVRIDTDGDGIADATRYLNLMQLARA